MGIGISNESNDYNPFNVKNIEVEEVNDFDTFLELLNSNTLYNYTKSQFSKIPINKKAAFANGIVRANYNKEWFIKQLDNIHEDNCTISLLGCISYICLKTPNEKYIKFLLDWNEKNINNNESF